jgi:hypothetical protein
MGVSDKVLCVAAVVGGVVVRVTHSFRREAVIFVVVGELAIIHPL